MNVVENFEQTIAEYYGSAFAVSTDCCTHAIELCLRLTTPEAVTCPAHTYVSIPMTLSKLNLQWSFDDMAWEDYYYLGNTNIIDAAVYWKKQGYIPDTLMCLSFQFKKHLNIGKGGMILLDNEEQYKKLIKMRYDGRVDSVPWKEQNIDTIGYHYYMTPENAQIGLEKFEEVNNITPKKWSWKDYPDLRTMKVFDAK